MWALGVHASAAPRDCAPVYGTGTAGAAAQPEGEATVAYGTVRSIEPLGIARDQPQGAGAVVGGVIGAVIGRQMADSSSGRNVAAAIGAAAGALIGNEIERNARRQHSGVRIRVTLDDGTTRHFDFKESGGVRVGDRVRVEGSMLYRIV
jgi:outer membrane lipoprotein SlyB